MSLNNYAAEHGLSEARPGSIFLHAAERQVLQRRIYEAIHYTLAPDVDPEMDAIFEVMDRAAQRENIDFELPGNLDEIANGAHESQGDIPKENDEHLPHNEWAIFFAPDTLKEFGFTEADDLDTIIKRLQDLKNSADEPNVQSNFADTEFAEIAIDHRLLITQAIRMAADELLQWVK